MKVIIAGSRPPEGLSAEDKPHWYDWALEVVTRAVDLSRFDITEIVSGTANGFDKAGEEWATRNGLADRIQRFPPDYPHYGRYLAPKMRNREMGRYADALIALTLGTPGTRDMIGFMRELDKPVRITNLHPDAWKRLRTEQVG